MLGRGLESLIPNKAQKNAPTAIGATAGKDEAVFQIEVDKISINPFQPRKSFDPQSLNELAVSIREFGILQPLIVSKVERETEMGTAVEYQLIAGERRLQAAKLLGLPRVPALVRAVPHEKERLELAIVENVQRENLNSMEAAKAYAKLQDTFGLTQREIAARVGKSRETIANMLRLLNLPSHIQEALVKNQVSESQARLLLAVSDSHQQEQLFNDITRNNLSVRELKNRISRIKKGDLPMIKLASADLDISSLAITDPELVEMQYSLEEALGTKVKIEKKGPSGELTISFSTPDDLQKLVQKLLLEE